MPRHNTLPQALVFLFCLLLFLLVPAPLHAAQITESDMPPLPQEEAEKVVARLRLASEQTTSMRCRFIQEKHLSIFARTIQSEGILTFRRPDALRWEYTAPVASGFVMQGGKGATWSNAGGTLHRTELKESREFAALSQQIMLWLAFDETQLRKQYTLDVLSASPAVLRLVPHNEAMRFFLHSLIISFVPDDSVAREVRIQEAAGDSTVLRFSAPERNIELPDEVFIP